MKLITFQGSVDDCESVLSFYNKNYKVTDRTWGFTSKADDVYIDVYIDTDECFDYIGKKVLVKNQGNEVFRVLYETKDLVYIMPLIGWERKKQVIIIPDDKYNYSFAREFLFSNVAEELLNKG